MEVQGPGGVSGPQRIEARMSPARAERTDVGARVGDRADISEAAQLLSKLEDVPDVRMDRVNDLREAIAAGRYESREKLEAAVERILEEIA